MRTHISIICLLTLFSSSKETLTVNTTSTPNGTGGITNFTNLSHWNSGRESHPFFNAMNLHKFYFEVSASPTDGSMRVGSYSSNIADESGKPIDIGTILIGEYEINAEENGSYTSSGAVQDLEFVNLFGKDKVDFRFTGGSGVEEFNGSLHLSEPVFIQGYSGRLEPVEMSRRGEVLTLSPDESNDGLPLVVTVSWTSDIDVENRSHKYNAVTNQFLLDDNGALRIEEHCFKDMPENAYGVTISLWRGNAAMNDQGFYFLGYTHTYFTVNLRE